MRRQKVLSRISGADAIFIAPAPFFHRWLPGVGRDVVVVASLNESTFDNRGYRIGFPGGGHWNEVLNSDIYDQWVTPNARGNPGGVTADGPSWYGLPASAGIALPANSMLFARG